MTAYKPFSCNQAQTYKSMIFQVINLATLQQTADPRSNNVIIS